MMPPFTTQAAAMLTKRFLSDRCGAIAPLFALVMVPVMAMVGAAVDYSRANAARTALQAALDSTALMLSKEAPELTPTQLTDKARAYFDAIFSYGDARNILVTPAFSTPEAGSFKLVVSGTGIVDTTVGRLLGLSELPIETSAEVVWGMKRLEVALALDNTGSMAWSNKMTEMKKAVHSLLNILEKAAKKPDDVKVAIIPFDTMVNVGTQVKDEFWIDYSVVSKASWNGCVDDRPMPHDVSDTSPINGNASTYYRARNCGSLTKALPLTSDWAALRAKVDQMQPNGNTNVTIGLVWAWHALTSTVPYTQASVPQPDLDKAIILLTDGENTRNRFTSNTGQINLRTAAACSNIRNTTSIKIYTVRVIEGNVALLKACATKPDMYYDVQQASNLEGVFTTIAQNLANLRVSK